MGEVGMFVEAAVGWLVQNILENLLGDRLKLKEWASEVGLGGDVEKLKEEVTKANMVLDTVRVMEFKNPGLAEYVEEMKQLLCDAEDVLDELDYFRLQEQEEGRISNPTSSGALRRVTDLATSTSGSVVSKIRHVFPKKRKLGDFALADGRVDDRAAAKERPVLGKTDISRRTQKIVQELCKVGESVFVGLKIAKLGSALSAPRSAGEDRQRQTTSFCAEPTEVFGRDLQRDEILELLKSDEVAGRSLSIVSIVGNGGLGKTTLAQLVYNDLTVRACFKSRMWICVSVSFDEVRLTKEMLESADGTKVELANFNKLQEILAEKLSSQRFLLVLDDIWQIGTDSQWTRFLAPLRQSPVKGNVILVTTRVQSVAEKIGTKKRIDLDVLNKEEYWKCFKAYAFGAEKYRKDQTLLDIGRQIADKLKGYPLAAKTVGALLKREHSVEHWMHVLENRAWKSQLQSDGIMPILKLSYDYLPSHLQRCFSYCSLFPKDHQFDGEDLVCVWISQGFIHRQHDNKTLEEKGSEYLNDLVKLGFFQKVKKKYSDTCYYGMHDLIHDLALMVSSNDCFTLDVSESTQLPPATVRHLSIITKGAHHWDETGHIIRNKSFEEKMDKVSKSLQTRNLRSLMVFGVYDASFSESLRNKFRDLKNLRALLQADQYIHHPIFCNLGQFIHLRYITFNAIAIASLEALCPLYHLQFLAINSFSTVDVPRSFCNLVNLRHFFAVSEMYSKIAKVGRLTFLQELQNFKVQKEEEFEIGQLGSLKELGGSLSIYNLENVESKQNATEARLMDKRRLIKLHFYWDKSRINARPAVEEEVLEGLRPHPNLKLLTIDGYAGATSPTWLGDSPSLISLQSLCLKDCKAWRTTFPSFSQFPRLKKLQLVKIPGAPEISTVSSLDEVVMEDLTELENWVVADENQLANSLQVLKISKCFKLRKLPFSHCSSSRVENNHWFSHLRTLTIEDCPQLMLLPPLPLGPKVSWMSIKNVGSSSYESLSLSSRKLSFTGNVESLGSLNERVLAFQNFQAFEDLRIIGCPNLTNLSWKGFQHLTSFKKLMIKGCPNIISIMPTTPEGQDDGKCISLPSLERLEISSCCISGKHISFFLSHQPSISYLKLEDCPGITSWGVDQHEEEGKSTQPSDGLEIASPLLIAEGLLTIPPVSSKSLQDLHIADCPDLVCANKQRLRGLVSLQKLNISGCHKLLCYDTLLEKEEEEEEHENSNDRWRLLPPSLQELYITDRVGSSLLFLSNLTFLTKLTIEKSSDLVSLDVRSCTILEMMRISSCEALSSLKGVQSCIHLRELGVYGSPGFWGALGIALQEQERQGHEFCLPLEKIETDDASFLILIRKHLASLRRLLFQRNEAERLTEQQEEALHLLTSLEVLRFDHCEELCSLLAKLHRLPSLEMLQIWHCPSIKSLQDQGLPPSLEGMDVSNCKNLQSLPAELHLLPSLKELRIHNCPGIQSLQDQGLPPSLEHMVVSNCKNLRSLPTELHRLPSLKSLYISSCPSIQSLQDQGLPPSLEEMFVKNCKNLRSLPTELHLLPFLKQLDIDGCAGIRSLPERGFPSSLEELYIGDNSEELKEQCRKIKNDRLRICLK